MRDLGFFLAALVLLLLYVTPALLATGHVLRHSQPRLWFIVFFCMPLLGPLLYMLWPKGGASRPIRR